MAHAGAALKSLPPIMATPPPKKPRLMTYECQGTKFQVPERYEVTGIVGKGAYGVVASGMDKVAQRKIAIKKVFDVFSKDREYQKRILRELLILHHFRNHENIICLTDLGAPPSFEDFNDVYICTEFMDSDMRAVVRSRQPLTDLNVQYFLYQLLRGLKYMHTANVLHRDLKPSNILLNGEMEIKICDFGLSRGVDFESDPTMSTTYVATRWYRAPELLLMWDKTSRAIDVWSVGCIFAELLDQPKPRRKVLFPGKHYLNQLDLILDFCGTPPHDEIRGCAKAKKYVQNLPRKKPKSVRRLFPRANPQALDLLEKMLQFDPIKRITVEDALAHPYLEKMHDPDDEPECDPFDFRFSQQLQSVSIKRMIYDFVMKWQREVHNYDGDATVSEDVIRVQ